MSGLIRAFLLAALLLWPDPVAAQRSEKQRTRPTPAVERVTQADAAAAIARQRALVEASLASLVRSDATEPSIYFVGFAGFAGADVFLREASGARGIVDLHLGTGGRSLLLANHRDTLDDLPLAAVETLEAALAGLGRIMSAEKDILVLFITTHGLPGELAVHFPGFGLAQMTPDRLAAALARSGIRNRVIVISACYSGSFIPALRSPDAMVITAARADRSSFGCNPQRAWTYFGDAFFNRALKSTPSLPAAFEQARVTVGQWEKAQKLTPSEPQIFVGDAIRPRLERLARSLGGAAYAAGN